MDQMQMGMLQLMQAVTAQQTQQTRKPEKSDSREFRDLMKRQSETKDGEPANAEEPKQPVQDAEAEKPEVDAAALQELAAMQMFCADTTQIVTPEEIAPVVGPVLQPTVLQTEVQQQAPQTAVAQQGVLQQKAPEPAAQAPVEQASEAVPETAVKAPQQSQPQGDSLQQETNLDKAPEKVRQQEKAPVETVDQVQVDDPEKQVFTKVETAPVKVSETGTEAPKAKEVAAQVTEKLTQAITKGETRVEVQLTPANLGKIVVELTQKGDGALQIVLHAENSQTRSLLERELPAMQGLLSRDTQQTVDVQVPREENAQRQDLNENPQNQQHQQQEQKKRPQNTEDFLNQLRLGLVPTDEAVS